MRTSRRSLLVLALAALTAVNGCSVYRAEVRQGNFMDQTKMDQVKPGMTREQVEFLLGPPMVTDPFHADRWDYVFTLQSVLTGHLILTRRFVVQFEDGVVREAKTVE